jgi:hypothetical protein
MALTALDVFNNYQTNRSGFIVQMNNDPNAGAMWDNFKSMSNKTSTSSSYGQRATTSAGQAIETLSGVQDIRQGVSLSPTELFQVSDATKYMKGIVDAIGKDGSLLDKAIGVLDASFFAPMKSAAEQITFFAKKEVDLRNEINSQLSMAGDMTLRFRDNIMDSAAGMADIGYGIDDVARTLISITKDTGTMSMIGSEVMERNRFTIRAAIGELERVPGFIKNFSDIGIGAEASFKQIEKSFKGSMELGLLGREVVTKIDSNLDKINQFGFRNGVDGLTRMVIKSTEFKVNMDSVFKIANDLFDPDKAIDLAANLQAIGGAIGGFNDPMRMMYNATNDVEGINDALIEAAGSLSTFNVEQGRFEVTGVNLRKAKAMADQFGMSMEDLAKISIKSSERQAASTALMSRGLSISDKEKEFLTNISRMEGGRMVIDVSSISEEFGGVQQIAMDTLTDTQLEKLKQFQTQFKEMDTKDIAREQFTTTQNIALNVSALVAMGRLKLGREAGELGKTLDDVFGKKLESALVKTKDKYMGKSTDDEVKKAFGESNRPSSSSFSGAKPSTSPQQSLPLSQGQMNSTTNTQTTAQGNQTTTTQVNVNVTSDVNMDSFGREFSKRPDLIDSFLRLEKGDYTTQTQTNSVYGN